MNLSGIETLIEHLLWILKAFNLYEPAVGIALMLGVVFWSAVVFALEAIYLVYDYIRRSRRC